MANRDSNVHQPPTLPHSQSQEFWLSSPVPTFVRFSSSCSLWGICPVFEICDITEPFAYLCVSRLTFSRPVAASTVYALLHLFRILFVNTTATCETLLCDLMHLFLLCGLLDLSSEWIIAHVWNTELEFLNSATSYNSSCGFSSFSLVWNTVPLLCILCFLGYFADMLLVTHC